MRKPLPSKEVLNELLTFDFETGKIYWKERSFKWFKEENYAKRWNARYSKKEAFSVTSKRGYLCGNIKGNKYYAHRIIYKMYYGVDPIFIDHINGIKDDNRIENLRSVTQQENCKNQSIRSNNTSGVIGVCFVKSFNKWKAEIEINYVKHHLGLFESLESAAAARKEAEIKYGFHENHGKRT